MLRRKSDGTDSLQDCINNNKKHISYLSYNIYNKKYLHNVS